MASYLISKEIKITRQEGDNGDIVFIIPDTLSLLFASAIFQVRDRFNQTIISKTTADGSMVISYPEETIINDEGDEEIIIKQQITVYLLPTDTKGHKGCIGKWELQLTDNTVGSYGIVTTGRGSFEIIGEIIT